MSHSGATQATVHFHFFFRAGDTSNMSWTCWDERFRAVRLAQIFGTHPDQPPFVCTSGSPDGDYVLSGAVNGGIWLWNTQNGGVEVVFGGHERSVMCLDWSPCGKFFASGGEDKCVRTWGIADRKQQWELRGHINTITCVAWSNDGEQLASGDCAAVIRLWDMSTGLQTRMIIELVCCVIDIQWKGRESFLMYMHNDQWLVWHNAKPCPESVCQGNPDFQWAYKPPHHKWTWRAFSSRPVKSPDNKLCARLFAFGKMFVYSANSSVNRFEITCPGIRHLTWTRNSSQIITIDTCNRLALLTMCTWSDRRHSLFAPEFIALVFYLLCVRQRLRAQGRDHLPMENWLEIFASLAETGSG
jgi:WD40 repeat protein